MNTLQTGLHGSKFLINKYKTAKKERLEAMNKSKNKGGITIQVTKQNANAIAKALMNFGKA